MTTKITNGRSNPNTGVINQQDLYRIIQDYENFAEIGSTIARNFKKTNSLTFPVQLMDKFLETLNGLTPEQRNKTNIVIKFGITLPGQKSCENTENNIPSVDISNHLTLVFMIEKEAFDLQDQVGNFVITPGFKDHITGGGTGGECCPIIGPGN